MAVIDFPAAPAVGAQYTQNGVTYTWTAEGWVLGMPQVPPLPPSIQIKRTPTNNNPPAALLEGELAVEMGAPTRLWVGVPPVIDPSGKKLLAFLGAGDPYVDTAGDTMTGDLAIQKDNPKLNLNRLTVAGGGADIVGLLAGVRRWAARFGNNTAEAGANAGSDFTLSAYTDAGVVVAPDILKGKRATNRIEVAGDPIAALDIATKQYADTKLAKAGGTMTGALVLAADPAAALQAATKQYVDAIVATPLDAMAFNGMQINGSMDIAQELASTSAPVLNGSKYICDVWSLGISSPILQLFGSQVAVNPAASPIGAALPNALLLQSSPGGAFAAADYMLLTQTYEASRWSRLGYGTANAQPITVAFWVWSNSVIGVGNIVLRNAAATRSYLANFNVNAINVWEYKTITIPGDVAGAWVSGAGAASISAAAIMGFCFGAGANWAIGAPGAWTASGNIATPQTTNFFPVNNIGVAITGITIIPGPNAPIATKHPLIMRPYAAELPLVQRYYRQHKWSVEGYSAAALNRVTNTSAIPPMRQPPTVTRITTGAFANVRGNDPANYCFISGLTPDSIMNGIETAAAGYTQATNFVDGLSARF